MLKINYPLEDKVLGFMHQQYLGYFKTAEMQLELDKIFKTAEMQRKLDKLFEPGDLKKFRSLKVEDILIAPIEDLLLLSNTLTQGFKSKPEKLEQIKKVFNYDIAANGPKLQPKIANFFMNQTGLDLSTCFFCNVDHINAFNDYSDYKSVLDLVKEGTVEDLAKIEGISKKDAKTIFNRKNLIKSESDITAAKLQVDKQCLKNLLAMQLKDKYNHFTLDHVLNKANFPIAALSLYNFVPCCYNCNSKFKRDAKLLTISAAISPTSKNFSLPDNVRFKIMFALNPEEQPGDEKSGKNKTSNGNKGGNKTDDFSLLKNISDFKLVFDVTKQGTVYEKYLSIFKLKGRYVFHKREVLKLLEKRRTYSDSQIREIAKITGKDELQVSKDIFGIELFEKNPESQPLTKLKRDIAKEIGIKGVK